MVLAGKKILLGVCGSISAYKAAVLTRLLVKTDAEVRVLMTPSAQEFITPLTLATLSRQPVRTRFVSDPAAGTWNNHVELGLWADVLLVAPLSATTLAKMAHGVADTLLTATYLSARCPVVVAPAMDLDMYAHPATQANLDTLRRYGHHVVPAESGELASGLSGLGRLAEPEHIVAFLENFYTEQLPQPLRGRRALVTAGPTYEALDPVRYLGNHSTGKMGYALAEALALAGADVTLVSGPTHLKASHPRVQTIAVTSARDMLAAVEAPFATSEVVVWAAAVADYTPRQISGVKLKKQGADWQLDLVETADIAATYGQRRRPDQLLVGFALETDRALENARRKLESKHLDLIVLNSLEDEGAGFRHDTNRVTLVDAHAAVPYPLKSKQAVAHDIVEEIVHRHARLLAIRPEPAGQPVVRTGARA